MTFVLISLGLIIGGILTLLTLVFGIIALANGKTNNALAWGGGFVVSLAIVLFSMFQLVHRVTDKVKNSIDWAKQQGTSTYDTTQEDEMRKTERQNWLDTLQAHPMAKYEGKVPPDFYINKPAVKDSNGTIIVPFVYPYSIRYNFDTYTGDLIMEGSDSVFVNNISQIAFDENFAIIKVDNSQSPALLKSGHAETEYMLYDMRSRNFESVPNNAKLLDLADRIGYVGPKQMQMLSDAYHGWIVYTDYD